MLVRVCQKHAVNLINLMDSKKQIMKNLYYKSVFLFFIIVDLFVELKERKIIHDKQLR